MSDCIIEKLKEAVESRAALKNRKNVVAFLDSLESYKKETSTEVAAGKESLPSVQEDEALDTYKQLTEKVGDLDAVSDVVEDIAADTNNYKECT